MIIPLFIGFYTSQVVQDFVHQQYHHCHYNLPVISHNDSFHHCNEVSWKNSSPLSKQGKLTVLNPLAKQEFNKKRSSDGDGRYQPIFGDQPSRLVPDVSHVFSGVWTEFFVAQNFSFPRHSQPAQKNNANGPGQPWSAVDTNLDFARLFCTNTWNERKCSI